MDYVGPGIRSS